MAKRKYVIFGVVFAIALFLDQITKVWARASLKPISRIVVVNGYFDFQYSENPGSAFGLFRDLGYARYLLFAIGIIALVVIFSFLRKVPENRGRIAAELGLLAGGAVGNIIDRVMFGKVTDFILWKVGEHTWPTFNIADAALVVGVIALMMDARGDEMSGKKKQPEPESEAQAVKKKR